MPAPAGPSVADLAGAARIREQLRRGEHEMAYGSGVDRLIMRVYEVERGYRGGYLIMTDDGTRVVGQRVVPEQRG
jgi:hypothetical protein